jgi:xylose isomerase
VANAQNRARVAFEFIEKLGAPYYCWHDRDVA